MIHVSLITPEKVVYQSDAESVTIPTTTGNIQVLAHHEPLISMLAPGELKIVLPGGIETKFLAVSQGFVEVRPHGDVVVLANTAEVAGEIDIDRAEAARARAKELLSGKIASEEEYATVAAAIEKEFARVKIGRKHATRHRTSIGE